MSTTRKSYPSDVTDAEWEFVVPYLTLMREDAPQQDYPLRELFNAVRYVVRTGCQWRFLPHDFPPWSAVYQQARRWFQAGVFETIELNGVADCHQRFLGGFASGTLGAHRHARHRPGRDDSHDQHDDDHFH